MRGRETQIFLCGSPLRAAERIGLMLEMGCKYCYLGPRNAWESLEAGIFQENELFLAAAAMLGKEFKLNLGN